MILLALALLVIAFFGMCYVLAWLLYGDREGDKW